MTKNELKKLFIKNRIRYNGAQYTSNGIVTTFSLPYDINRKLDAFSEGKNRSEFLRTLIANALSSKKELTIELDYDIFKLLMREESIKIEPSPYTHEDYETVSVTLPEDLRDKLTNHCKYYNISRSFFLKELIESLE